jgi:predicted HD superfamily hydrolase involved in NAD metabolism
VLNALQQVLTPLRFQHSLNVASLAKQLAQIHHANPELAELAGQFHDCAREYSVAKLKELAAQYQIKAEPFEWECPILLHSPVGAVLAQQIYGVTESSALSAIRWHSIGNVDMSLMEKILFVADYCSADRKFPEAVAVREVALKDLDHAVYLKFFNEKQHNDSINRQNPPAVLQYINMHSRSFS